MPSTPWTCTSMKPGTMRWPPTATSAPPAARRRASIATIRPSSMSERCHRERTRSGSTTSRAGEQDHVRAWRAEASRPDGRGVRAERRQDDAQRSACARAEPACALGAGSPRASGRRRRRSCRRARPPPDRGWPRGSTAPCRGTSPCRGPPRCTPRRRLARRRSTWSTVIRDRSPPVLLHDGASRRPT